MVNQQHHHFPDELRIMSVCKCNCLPPGVVVPDVITGAHYPSEYTTMLENLKCQYIRIQSRGQFETATEMHPFPDEQSDYVGVQMQTPSSTPSLSMIPVVCAHRLPPAYLETPVVCAHRLPLAIYKVTAAKLKEDANATSRYKPKVQARKARKAEDIWWNTRFLTVHMHLYE